MKKITLLSTLAATLFVSFAAHAAETTELKVKGVVRPAACTPSFTSGGVIDYGTIPAKSLSATDYTVLTEKTIAFTVTCDGDAKVAISGTDNRASSVLAGGTTKINSVYADNYSFGLGSVGGKNIGAYIIRLMPTTFNSTNANGTASNNVDIIQSDNGGSNWATTGTVGAFYKARMFSFGAGGTTTPAAYKTLTGTLAVQAVLNKSTELPVTQDIQLDGSATLEVKYL